MNRLPPGTVPVIVTLLCLRVATAQDRDDDGVPDAADNCPALQNANQHDVDGDGFGLPCDCEDAAYVIQRGPRRPPGEEAQEVFAIVSSVGDLDGDGVDDLVLGGQRPLDDCEDAVSRARVLSGRTRALLWELSSGEPCDGFGFAVSGAGDVDGDGLGDIIVGADGGGDGGRVYLYSGATAELLSRSGARFTFAGQRPGDRFGTSVAGVGDVDRDGVDDVAVGAPFSDTNGPARGRPGRVYVFRGGAPGQAGAGEPLYTIDGSAEGELFGSALAAGGDFNGDGVPDIAVGAAPALRTAPGRARVCSGADGATLLELEGSPAGEVFAAAIAFAGDVNGDGFDDVIVGAPGGPHQAGSPGRVVIMRGGAPGSPAGEPGLLGVIEGLEGAGLFGTSVAGIGDQNGDGFDDIAIGAPRVGSGEARGAGRVQVYSVRDRSVLADFGGGGPRAGFGRAIAALGDLDRSGHRDLAVADIWQGGTVSVYLLGDADGNGRRDACEPCRGPDAIQPGESIDVDLCPLVPRRCFRIDPVPGQVLRVALESTVDDETVMALGWGTPPSERQFDELATRKSESVQHIVISRARRQTAYVVVESLKTDACTGDLRIRLEGGDAPIVDEVIPRTTGSDRLFDGVVLGAGFVNGLDFSLLSRAPADPPLEPFTAVTTTIIDGETAEVTFDLRGAPFGLYDLVGRIGDQPVVRLEKAFGVGATSGPALQVALDGPVFYRVRDRGTLTLRFANKGDEEIPAPLFLVTTEGDDVEAEMRLATDTSDDWRPVVQVLGIHRQGPVHTLPPGATGKARIYFRSPVRCNLCRLRFRVQVFTPDPRDFIDWQRLPNPDPMHFPDEDWQRVLSPLSVNLGLTWGDYHGSLLDRARRLARRGRNAASVRDIFRFSVAEALSRGSAAIVGSVIEASELSPIASASVIARSGDEARSVAVTDARGRFVLEGLEAGTTYDVSVAGHAPGAETPTRIAVPEERYSAAGDGDVLGVVLAVEPGGAADDGAPVPDVEQPLPESALVPPESLFTTVAGAEVRIVLSRDPNKKTFNVTPGDVLFFDDEEEEPEEPEEPEDENVVPPPVIEYTIFFENSRCASVAARTVTIIDTLNTDMFDLATLRLEAMSIGEDLEEKLVVFDDDDADIFTQRLVTRTLHDVPVAKVPPVREFPPECDGGELPDCEGDEEMDPEADPPDYATLEEVVIKVGLREVAEENKTELIWDIDGCPSSCLSIVGFLPPNDCGTHQGEGFVCFTVSPRAEFADGVVENDVDVVFDDDYTAALSHHVTTDLGPTAPPEPAADPVPRDNPGQDDDFLVPVDQSLSWAPVLHADRYRLSVWKLDGDGARVAEVVAVELAETFYRPDPPWELSTTYEWELIAANDLGDSPASRWVFRTESLAPPTPELDFVPLHPPVGSEEVVTDLELAWDFEGSGEPSSFTVFLWDSADDRGRPDAHIGNVTTYRPNDLEFGVAYNWQVVGVNSGGSVESEVWNFSIGEGAGEPDFLRGDANADGEVNIADAILTLNFLFLGDSIIPCLGAADFDDDGALLITDPIAQVGFLFLGGPPAPPPTGACGPDGTPDALGCEAFAACP